MKNLNLFLLFILVFSVFSVSQASADLITGTVLPTNADGTYNPNDAFSLEFNWSSSVDCSDGASVVFSNQSILVATGDNGVANWTITTPSFNSLSEDNIPYHVCIYINGTLESDGNLSSSIIDGLYAQKIKVQGNIVSGGNITVNNSRGGHGLFAFIGDSVNRAFGYFSDIDVSNTANATLIYANGKNLEVGYDYTTNGSLGKWDSNYTNSILDLPYNFSVGTSDFFVDNNAGRVGIGTDSPNSGYDLTLSSGTLHLGTGGSQNITFGGGGTLTFLDGALNTMFSLKDSGSTTTAYFNGFVGIGTSTPDTELHVAGSSGTTAITIEAPSGQNSRVFFDEAGTVKWNIGLTSSNGFFTLYDQANGKSPIKVEPNTADGLLYLSSSAVGIGTSTPQNTLNVAGVINVTTNLAINDGSADSNPSLRLINDVQEWRLQTRGSDSNDRFILWDITSGNYKPFQIDKGTPTNTLYLNSSGYVGIGTATPATNLHVYSTGTPELRLENGGSSYSSYIQTDSGGYIGLRNSTGTANAVIRSYGITYFNGGDVGIGTDSPNKALDVRGGD